MYRLFEETDPKEQGPASGRGGGGTRLQLLYIFRELIGLVCNSLTYARAFALLVRGIKRKREKLRRSIENNERT